MDALPPSLSELGVGANVALRDLQFSQALRAALRTHKSGWEERFNGFLMEFQWSFKGFPILFN